MLTTFLQMERHHAKAFAILNRGDVALKRACLGEHGKRQIVLEASWDMYNASQLGGNSKTAMVW